MGNIISLILSIVMLYVIYYIFSNYDFKTALIVNMAYGIIVSIINNGFNILAIILGIIVTAVEVYILYKIYNKSNSFLQFLGKALLFAIIVVAILVVIGVLISFIMGSNGILKN